MGKINNHPLKRTPQKTGKKRNRRVRYKKSCIPNYLRNTESEGKIKKNLISPTIFKHNVTASTSGLNSKYKIQANRLQEVMSFRSTPFDKKSIQDENLNTYRNNNIISDDSIPLELKSDPRNHKRKKLKPYRLQKAMSFKDIPFDKEAIQNKNMDPSRYNDILSDDFIPLELTSDSCNRKTKRFKNANLERVSTTHKNSSLSLSANSNTSTSIATICLDTPEPFDPRPRALSFPPIDLSSPVTDSHCMNTSFRKDDCFPRNSLLNKTGSPNSSTPKYNRNKNITELFLSPIPTNSLKKKKLFTSTLVGNALSKSPIENAIVPSEIIQIDDSVDRLIVSPTQKDSHNTTTKYEQRIDTGKETSGNTNIPDVPQNVHNSLIETLTDCESATSFVTVDQLSDSDSEDSQATVINIDDSSNHTTFHSLNTIDLTIGESIDLTNEVDRLPPFRDTETSFDLTADNDDTVINMRQTKRAILDMPPSQQATLLEMMARNILGDCFVPTLNEQYRPSKTSYDNPVGSNVYCPGNDRRKKRTGLRMIVIDGSNVAISYSNGKFFSVEALKICIDYFIKKGHEVKAFVPQFRRLKCKSSNQQLLNLLFNRGFVVYTPAREIQGRWITSYDDRYIIQCAAEFQGVIVSGDNFRDLLKENPSWRDTIENHVLPFTWVGNMIMFPQDPLGKHGPRLDTFLKHPS